MEKHDYNVGIPPGYKDFVVSLRYNNRQWGALIQEDGKYILEIYTLKDVNVHKFEYDSFIDILEKAKHELSCRK